MLLLELMLWFARTWNIKKLKIMDSPASIMRHLHLECIFFLLLIVLFPVEIVKNGLLWKQSPPASWWKEGWLTWFGFYILLLEHLLPVPSACRRGEWPKSTTARPKITVFMGFIPKPLEMFIQMCFFLRALISAAIAEQTERDHQLPVTTVGNSPRRPG